MRFRTSDVKSGILNNVKQELQQVAGPDKVLDPNELARLSPDVRKAAGAALKKILEK